MYYIYYISIPLMSNDIKRSYNSYDDHCLLYQFLIGLLTSLAGSTEINFVKAGKYTILELGTVYLPLYIYYAMIKL